MSKNTNRLSADQLYRHCDVSQFDFETTASLPNNRPSIGQERALEAIRFGVNIEKQGYNLYVLGPTGAGKHTLVNEVLKQSAPKKNTGYDWCYLHNFQQSHIPLALKLPAGIGKKLRRDLQELTNTLSHVIPTAFEAESYDKQLLSINHTFQTREESAFNQLEQNAKQKNIAFLQTDSDFTFAPLVNGESMTPAEFDQLSEEEQQALQEQISELQHELQGILQHIPKWQQEQRKKVASLNESIAKKSVGYWMTDLKRKYQEHETVVKHIQNIEQDVIENVENFLPQHNQENTPESSRVDLKTFLNRYHLNLMVDHSNGDPAPVIYEANPTLDNLIGKIDSISQYGTLVTNFTLIKAGALHKANGGFLIVDAFKLLNQPFAWEALKRALSSREIVIDPGSQSTGLPSTITLNPEPIPLDVKIILLGDHHLYLTLFEQDPEFDTLFKVVADMEDTINRNDQTMLEYAQLIASQIEAQELHAFDKHAVARVIEHSSRLIENTEKLATHNGELRDLLTEADYWAQQNQHDVVGKKDVEKAIAQQLYRFSRIRSEVHESILKDITRITTDGTVIGQVNGLTVASLGFFSFGQPSRITAVARLGDGKIIDIESEANLSGDIHTKGILILSNFFSSRYAKNKHLSFTASIVFEQSYGEIDGDSASVAELAAIMSAIAEIPLKQSIAITGAIDQHGLIQAIGGINEKIEGFFDICQKRGLNGEHGVIIPKTNVHQLMLRSDVVEAAKADLFQIYAVESIDQVLEILTDLPAGVRDKNGQFDANSVNAKVEVRLLQLAKIAAEEHEHDENKSHHEK